MLSARKRPVDARNAEDSQRERGGALAGVARGVLYYVMFPVFVIGALLFYVVLRIWVAGASRERRELTARFFIHQGAKLLFCFLRIFSLVKVSFDDPSEGAADPRSAVVVANHPSMLDAMLLLSELPNAVCIMKRSLLRIPVISGFAAMAGYVAQSDAPELLRAGRRVLSQGGSIIIFPEGTRSQVREIGAFHRGAARLAVETGAAVKLFALSMSPVVLGRGPSGLLPPRGVVWYQAVCIEMVKHEMDRVGGPGAEDIREESVRLTRYLEDRLRNSLS